MRNARTLLGRNFSQVVYLYLRFVMRAKMRLVTNATAPKTAIVV